MTIKQCLALYRALGNETRLAIVRLLASAERPGLRSGQVARSLGISPTTASHHLYLLRKANVVFSSKTDSGNIYNLSENLDNIYKKAYSYIIIKSSDV